MIRMLLLCVAVLSGRRRRADVRRTSSTAGRCTTFVCTFTRAIFASFASGTSKTSTCRQISSGAAFVCATSACACAGWQPAAPSSWGCVIDFNRYVAGQAFLGMAALVLDNALKDPSFAARAHEHGVHQADGAAGAARVVRARLYQRCVRGALYARRGRRQRLPRARARRRARLPVRAQVRGRVSMQSFSATTTRRTRCGSRRRRIGWKATTRCTRRFESCSAR